MDGIYLQGISRDELFKKFDSLEESIKKLEASKQQTPEPKPLSQKELCKLYNVSRTTVHNWEKTGKVKGRRIGRRVYYYQKDVEVAMKGVI